MHKAEIFDPFTGLPVTLMIYDDGSVSFDHLVTHETIHAKFAGEYFCIPVIALENNYSISANEAADRLDVTRMRITQLCNEGRLRSSMIGASLFVSYDDVVEYEKSDRTPGRREKEK